MSQGNQVLIIRVIVTCNSLESDFLLGCHILWADGVSWEANKESKRPAAVVVSDNSLSLAYVPRGNALMPYC